MATGSFFSNEYIFLSSTKYYMEKAMAPHSSTLAWKIPWMEEPGGLGFYGGSEVKNPPASVGDVGLISGLERSPGGGHGRPLQYSYLENPMDRGAWWATVHGVTESWRVLKQFSIHACTLKEETVVTENRAVVAGGLEAGAGSSYKEIFVKEFLG